MAKQVTRTIVVKGKASEIYQIWANFENFPHFMKHIKQVTKTGERHSHWVMHGPLGKDISWDAETTRLDENTRIAWNSRDSGDITTSGQVTFAELPQGQTEVTVTMQYVPPAGKLGELVARVFSDPEGQLEEDLENFKHFAEHSRAVGG